MVYLRRVHPQRMGAGLVLTRALKVKCQWCGKVGKHRYFRQWAGGWECLGSIACRRRIATNENKKQRRALHKVDLKTGNV
jgi:hypothetical protein